MNKITLALIAPKGKGNYTPNTIIDGLLALEKEGKVTFFITENYPCPYDIEMYSLPTPEFIERAKSADLILLLYGKNTTQKNIAEQIGEWQKIIYIDGSELGGDKRYDAEIQEQVLRGTFTENGKIDEDLFSKCALYFRREKPYRHSIIPLPYGIESRYIFYTQGQKKDIDFTCVFGQEEYPQLRRQVRGELELFCEKEGFVCHTQKTKGFTFDDHTKQAGRDEYYDILARTKVGISVGGGGFDTARFWEILGNNCDLLTETIDIFEPNHPLNNYKRIHQFADLEGFKEKLKTVGDFLRTKYDATDRIPEYVDIMKNHSTRARILSILNHSADKNIIPHDPSYE
jgi:hypothetical protein